jgi:hypothetical protein
MEAVQPVWLYAELTSAATEAARRALSNVSPMTFNKEEKGAARKP